MCIYTHVYTYIYIYICECNSPQVSRSRLSLQQLGILTDMYRTRQGTVSFHNFKSQKLKLTSQILKTNMLLMCPY